MSLVFCLFRALKLYEEGSISVYMLSKFFLGMKLSFDGKEFC